MGGMWRGRAWAVALVLAGVAAGCGHRIPLESRAAAFGSDGRVTVVDRDHGIRVVKVQIDDLVDPRRVAPSARSYIVWARRVGGSAVENVGPMRLLSNRGVLEAVAPPGAFHLFVTAEASEDTAAPSNEPIFFADVDRTEPLSIFSIILVDRLAPADEPWQRTPG